MLVKRHMKWAVVISTLLLLAACSSTRHGNTSRNGSDVEVSGLGAVSRFPGINAGVVNPQTGEKYNTVYFEFNSDTILGRYTPVIQANAAYLKTHPEALVRLEGHTDPRGSREYNIGLGQRRGNSVADALEMLGVPRSQYVVVSYGKEKLAVPGDTEEDYRLDRRVEIIYERQ